MQNSLVWNPEKSLNKNYLALVLLYYIYIHLILSSLLVKPGATQIPNIITPHQYNNNNNNFFNNNTQQRKIYFMYSYYHNTLCTYI